MIYMLKFIDFASCQDGSRVSSGGGQSSLGYLFGGDEAPKSTGESAAPAHNPAPPPPVENSKQIPAGIQGSLPNNYHRADGQNTGNFITLFVLMRRETIPELDLGIQVFKINLQRRCKLLLVVVLPWVTCLGVVATDVILAAEVSEKLPKPCYCCLQLLGRLYLQFVVGKCLTC
ncbi:hypothetical protein MUK42_07498 [Musa troglodytarum]|uniref:Uncharacterized protein n=1 Tax=Musa troglodytarum TaxID=320322 RepID=A0A9E7EH79_9LILI|nr:hypothetical protein MUK42_07498 [Musa troglodytarum]